MCQKDNNPTIEQLNSRIFELKDCNISILFLKIIFHHWFSFLGDSAILFRCTICCIPIIFVFISFSNGLVFSEKIVFI